MQSIRTSSLFCFALSGLLACGAPPSPEPTKPVEPPPIEVTTAQTGLVFRFLDPQSGEVASASALDAIPEAARREVVIYDPTREPPPGWDYVADLSRGLPATASPRASFDFKTRSASAPVERNPVAATPTASREVVMFSTQGCGYCNKARKFLTSNRIPFTELDVEEDPSAPARLSSLGQKAGLGPRDLQGVPILFFDGKPMIGWDERRAAKLLGLGG
jgi:glutaredoxin